MYVRSKDVGASATDALYLASIPVYMFALSARAISRNYLETFLVTRSNLWNATVTAVAAGVNFGYSIMYTPYPRMNRSGRIFTCESTRRHLHHVRSLTSPCISKPRNYV